MRPGRAAWRCIYIYIFTGTLSLLLSGRSPTYTPAEIRDLVYDASIRAPICFDGEAARTVRSDYELRRRPAMEGRTPDEITRIVELAYKKGDVAKRERVTFAYMWSADQHLSELRDWTRAGYDLPSTARNW